MRSNGQRGTQQLNSPSLSPLLPDADWVFPDFGKGKLHWEDDIEMLSHFLDRKDELKEDHVNYMKRHPELKAILGDFLQVGSIN